ncbi:hypothetical protein GCM10029992_66820 [Glycomyces albus]
MALSCAERAVKPANPEFSREGALMTTTDRTAVTSPPRASISARNLRTDNWMRGPVLTVVGLTAWVAYATFRVFYQGDYWVADYHYLTPFYSPCVSEGACPTRPTSDGSCPTTR